MPARSALRTVWPGTHCDISIVSKHNLVEGTVGSLRLATRFQNEVYDYSGIVGEDGWSSEQADNAGGNLSGSDLLNAAQKPQNRLIIMD